MCDAAHCCTTAPVRSIISIFYRPARARWRLSCSRQCENNAQCPIAHTHTHRTTTHSQVLMGSPNDDDALTPTCVCENERELLFKMHLHDSTPRVVGDEQLSPLRRLLLQPVAVWPHWVTLQIYSQTPTHTSTLHMCADVRTYTYTQTIHTYSASVAKTTG